MKVNILTLSDPGYPAILRSLNKPPSQLFWAGLEPWVWQDAPKVAIVGSRKASAYGLAITAKIAGELAEGGVVVISGLAFGIDAAAHRGALQAGGVTVAVLPTSLSRIYPAAHQLLSNQILTQNGCLISEYAAGSITFKENFIARNRIVSGLADILIITEATINSGSLHTARFALDQGKTVMAAPGNITSSTSEGCNNLIKSGAVPVTAADDVWLALGYMAKKKARPRPFRGSEQERVVLQLIGDGVTNQEELALASQIDSAAIASALTMLEITGQIRPQGSGHWTVS